MNEAKTGRVLSCIIVLGFGLALVLVAYAQFAGAIFCAFVASVGLWAAMPSDARCPQCQGKLRLQATKCHHCGSALAPQRPPR